MLEVVGGALGGGGVKSKLFFVVGGNIKLKIFIYLCGSGLKLIFIYFNTFFFKDFSCFKDYK